MTLDGWQNAAMTQFSNNYMIFTGVCCSAIKPTASDVQREEGSGQAVESCQNVSASLNRFLGVVSRSIYVIWPNHQDVTSGLGNAVYEDS